MLHTYRGMALLVLAGNMGGFGRQRQSANVTLAPLLQPEPPTPA